jgi:hypothetical protein
MSEWSIDINCPNCKRKLNKTVYGFIREGDYRADSKIKCPFCEHEFVLHKRLTTMFFTSPIKKVNDFGLPILSDAEIEEIAPMPQCKPPKEEANTNV